MPLFSKKIPFLFALVILSQAVLAKVPGPEHYVIDTAHSSITFKVRHFLSNITGTFERFEGEIWLDREDIAKSYMEARIYPTTVDTNDNDRDKHLRSIDFLNVKAYPTITFKSTEWKTARTSKHEYIIEGELTLLGQTHPVTLYASLLGFGHNNRGAYLSGWQATTTLNRKTWGMTYGGPAVGTEVSIDIEVEAIRKPQ